MTKWSQAPPVLIKPQRWRETTETTGSLSWHSPPTHTRSHSIVTSANGPWFTGTPEYILLYFCIGCDWIWETSFIVSTLMQQVIKIWGNFLKLQRHLKGSVRTCGLKTLAFPCFNWLMLTGCYKLFEQSPFWLLSFPYRKDSSDQKVTCFQSKYTITH